MLSDIILKKLNLMIEPLKYSIFEVITNEIDEISLIETKDFICEDDSMQSHKSEKHWGFSAESIHHLKAKITDLCGFIGVLQSEIKTYEQVEFYSFINLK